MKDAELYATLMGKLVEIAEEHHLSERKVKVHCRALSTRETIGTPERKDFPILAGEDVMVQAEFEGGIGQAYTRAPVVFTGNLMDVFDLDPIRSEHDRTIFIAALNAVTRRAGICDRSIHCRDNGPERCADKAIKFLKEHYEEDIRIAQVGYQPSLLAAFSKNFSQVRVLDLNPDNVGDTRSGIRVLDGVKDYEETVRDWAQLVICTGSTLTNGTIENFLDLGKEVLFYGTTAAGAAALMGWERLCFAD